MTTRPSQDKIDTIEKLAALFIERLLDLRSDHEAPVRHH
jgi:hypothetical protein